MEDKEFGKKITEINEAMHAITQIHDVAISDMPKMVIILSHLTGAYLAFAADFTGLSKEEADELLDMAKQIVDESMHSIDIKPRVHGRGSEAIN